jgi:hypothetical protein
LKINREAVIGAALGEPQFFPGLVLGELSEKRAPPPCFDWRKERPTEGQEAEPPRHEVDIVSVCDQHQGLLTFRPTESRPRARFPRTQGLTRLKPFGAGLGENVLASMGSMKHLFPALPSPFPALTVTIPGVLKCGL